MQQPAKLAMHQKSGGAGGSITGILEVRERFLEELGYDFLQLHSQMRTCTDLIKSEVLTAVKGSGCWSRSAAFAHLASKMSGSMEVQMRMMFLPRSRASSTT